MWKICSLHSNIPIWKPKYKTKYLPNVNKFYEEKIVLKNTLYIA